MKKLITFLLALILSVSCLSITACNNSNNKTLYVYTSAGFAPYEFISEKGEVVGADIELMKKIGEALGYNVVITDIKFNQILYEVSQDPLAIGAAAMTRTDERDEIALPSIPYVTSIQYVIAPKGTFNDDLVDGKLSMTKLANLQKKTIGYQNGTTGEVMLLNAINGTKNEQDEHVLGELENKNVSSVGYTNAIIASQDIGTSLGAVIIDKLPAESITNANPNLECYELDSIPEQYVLYLNKNSEELLTKINAVLQTLIDDGVIDSLILKYSGDSFAKQ